MLTLLLAIAFAAEPQPEERTAFVCRMGSKTTTVVRSGLNVAYRSERVSGLELQLPGGYVSRIGPGDDELQTVFRNGPWTYVAYERATTPKFAKRAHSPLAGVAVLKRGRVISDRGCDNGQARFDAEALEGLPAGRSVAH